MSINDATHVNGSFYDRARLGSVVYLCMVGTCGIIANCLVIFVFWKYPKLRTAANLFILNLALCDLMLSVLDNTFSIASTLHGKWLFGREGCVSYGFFHYFFICCTVSTLAAISVDRFFFITRPSQTRAAQMITRRKAIGILVIIYLYTLLFTFPPCVGWNDFVVEESFYSGCYINYGDQKTSSIVYSIFAPLFLFLVPLTIMIYCYARIFVAVRRSSQRTIIRSLGSLKRYPLHKRTHIQTAKMIVAVIFFSMIVWVPYVVVSFVKAANGKVNPFVSHVTLLVAKSCVIYNVLIYAILNRKLKAAILDAICCGRHSFSLAGSPGSGNSLQRNRISRILSETEVPSHIAEAQKNRVSTLSIQQANENQHDQYTDGSSPSHSPKLKNGVLKSVEFEDGQKSYKVELNTSKEDIGVVVEEEECSVEEKTYRVIDTRVDVTTRPPSARSSAVATNGLLVRSEDIRAANIIIPPQDDGGKPRDLNSEAESRASSLSRNSYLAVGYKADTPLCDSAGSSLEFNRVHHLYSSKSSKNSRLQNLSSPSQLYQKGARPTSAQRVTRRISTDSRNPRASGDSTDQDIDLSRRNSRDYSRDSSFSQRSATTQRPKRPRAGDKTNSKHVPGRRSHSYVNYGRKGSAADPLRTSAKELLEIQNYWKRMSLCLDDIDVDDVTREIEMV